MTYNGKINAKAAEKKCNDEYKGIFGIFTDEGIIRDNKKYEFVPFSTGEYDENGMYTASKDKFPKDLWKTIRKLIKPSLW